MLGTRGVRLGILYPEIYEMQVHAIMLAAKAVDEPPHPEIMIPLVAYEHEIEIMRELVVSVATSTACASGGLHGRDDDRAAARVLHRQPDRPARRLLLVRHERPDPDRARLLARRRRIEVHPDLHRAQDPRPLAVRDDRQPGRGVAGPARGVGWPRGASRASSSGSAASTAATPTRSCSSTTPASTTCRARRSACRSPGSRPRRPRSRPLRASGPVCESCGIRAAPGGGAWAPRSRARACPGSQFDPTVVDAFLASIEPAGEESRNRGRSRTATEARSSSATRVVAGARFRDALLRAEVDESAGRTGAGSRGPTRSCRAATRRSSRRG